MKRPTNSCRTTNRSCRNCWAAPNRRSNPGMRMKPCACGNHARRISTSKFFPARPERRHRARLVRTAGFCKMNRQSWRSCARVLKQGRDRRSPAPVSTPERTLSGTTRPCRTRPGMMRSRATRACSTWQATRNRTCPGLPAQNMPCCPSVR